MPDNIPQAFTRVIDAVEEIHKKANIVATEGSTEGNTDELVRSLSEAEVCVLQLPVSVEQKRQIAGRLVFVHNHPNGQAQPSEQDKLLTRALVLDAETVQLKVLDHLIVTREDVFCFRWEGLL